MRSSLVDAYRRERRDLQVRGYRREDFGVFVRYTPEQPHLPGFIQFTDVPEHALAEEIERQVAHFQAHGCDFEWKVYGADSPPGLREALRRAGFEEDEPEALMVLDVDAFVLPARAQGGIGIHRLEDPDELVELVAFQEAIWAREFPWLLWHLRSMWDFTSFFAARQGERMVGSGYIEYPRESRFAELHGGAVVPELRGQGIYSRLFEVRVLDARARGIPWIAVDAAPMSRPILEAKGFMHLDTTWPLSRRAAESDGS